MPDDVLSPLIGATLRIQDREGLEEFLASPDAESIVHGSSFEQIFFTSLL